MIFRIFNSGISIFFIASFILVEDVNKFKICHSSFVKTISLVGGVGLISKFKSNDGIFL